MLKPIPRQILSQNMVLHVPTSCDEDYVTTYDNLNVAHVHLQGDLSIIKQSDNTEVQSRGVVFVDKMFTSPRLDYTELQRRAHEIGANLRLTIDGNNYEVLTVDGVPDDHGHLHHWELTVV